MADWGEHALDGIDAYEAAHIRALTAAIAEAQTQVGSASGLSVERHTVAMIRAMVIDLASSTATNRAAGIPSPSPEDVQRWLSHALDHMAAGTLMRMQ